MLVRPRWSGPHSARKGVALGRWLGRAGDDCFDLLRSLDQQPCVDGRDGVPGLGVDLVDERVQRAAGIAAIVRGQVGRDAGDLGGEARSRPHTLDHGCEISELLLRAFTCTVNVVCTGLLLSPSLSVAMQVSFAMSLDLNSTRSVLKSGSMNECTFSKHAVYVVVPGTTVNVNSAPVSTKSEEPGVCPVSLG